MRKEQFTASQLDGLAMYADEMLYEMLDSPDDFGFAVFMGKDGEWDGRLLKYKEEPPNDAFLVVRACSIDDMRKAVKMLTNIDLLDEFEQVEIMADYIKKEIARADDDAERIEIDILELAQAVEDAASEEPWDELWPPRPYEI